MTRRRNGFLLGKFLPPHSGHVFMCEAGARMVERLSVLVCSTDAEPIPGERRATWMRELLPGCRILHMHRDIPQEPAEHPDFWPIWRAAIAGLHPEPIDRVFGSEPYVFRLARELGAEPVLLDPARELVPVSGRAVRADPARHWHAVPGPVRAWFRRRVCLLGPESTGKSTMARALAQRFGADLVPEYGRVYDAHYRQGTGWSAGDFAVLAETHVALRDAFAPAAGPLIVEDTDPLQTATWSEQLVGGVGAALETLLARLEFADLYLLLTPEVPWHDDGTRYTGDSAVRGGFFERLKARLAATGAPFETVTGDDWNVRMRRAEEIVAARFAPLLRT